jgi:hypothetical protein
MSREMIVSSRQSAAHAIHSSYEHHEGRFINALSSLEVIGLTRGPREEGKRQGELVKHPKAMWFRRIEDSGPVSKTEQMRQTIGGPVTTQARFSTMVNGVL